MHALVVKVTIAGEPDTRVLREQVIPRVKEAPGFVAGYWTREGEDGLSMVVFDNEEQARTASERIPSMLPDNVTLQSAEVRSVVAHA